MKRLALAGLVVLLGAVSCDRSDTPARQIVANASKGGSPQPLTDQRSVFTDPSRKLIRDVDLDLTVKDVEVASEKAQEIATSLGGYVASANTTGGKKAVDCNLVLRIPAQQFDAGVTALKILATRVNVEKMRAEDVTEKHVDLEARLKTLSLTEKEIQKLLEESKARGHKITDIMALYKELTDIRGQSEQVQGQLNLLNKLVAFSTLRVVLHPEETLIETVQKRWHPTETARRSWRALLTTLQVLGDLLIMVGVYLVPLGILLAIPITLVFRLKKRLDHKLGKLPPPVIPPNVRG